MFTYHGSLYSVYINIYIKLIYIIVTSCMTILSLLVLIEQSRGTNVVLTVGWKGHIERAKKGVISCFKPIQAEDDKGRGGYRSMIRVGLLRVTLEQSIKLWRRRYTGCIILKNDIRFKVYLHIPETSSRKTK